MTGRKRKRCPFGQSRSGKGGKIMFKDAGEAATHVQAGEFRGIYLCPNCKHYHLTHDRQR